ncbi:MAG TPA: hypothetical protein VF255_00235 [Solirubrobacterales bacterium]
MAAIVVDRPEREPRRYQREWHADRWRGTPTDFVSGVEAALEELKPHISYEPRPTATFEFRDKSHQIVHGINPLRQMAEASAPSEIKNLAVEFDGPPSFSISGAALNGLTIKAEGSHGFAVGLVGMLAFRLAEGKEAAEKVAPPSIRAREWFLFVLAPVLLVGTFLFMYLTFDRHAVFDLIYYALMAAAGAFIPVLIAGGMSMDYAFRVGPSRFVLVQEGEQVPDESGRRGPIWAARDWFKSHPAIAYLATAGFSGLVGAVIAKGIDGL